ASSMLSNNPQPTPINTSQKFPQPLARALPSSAQISTDFTWPSPIAEINEQKYAFSKLHDPSPHRPGTDAFHLVPEQRLPRSRRQSWDRGRECRIHWRPSRMGLSKEGAPKLVSWKRRRARPDQIRSAESGRLDCTTPYAE